MVPDVADKVKRPIQEYSQRNSEMGGNRGSHGRQVKWEQKSSATERSKFKERRVQLTQSWKEEGFSSIDQAVLM